MTTPKKRLEMEIREALKSGQKQRLATLRLLLTAVTNERIAQGEEVDEAGFLRLVQKAIKQRRDSAEQYRNGGREELATNEEAEAEILNRYLPEQVDEDELRRAILEFVEHENLAGASAIGQVMKEMMTRFSGRAEGSSINMIAREILAQRTE
ncbi:MAG: GatB/YqeY domain-containing protein [Acidobacteriota bacterium]|nr:GatB/YqeY domain-containing protein [Acidobacteriota bacterium]